MVEGEDNRASKESCTKKIVRSSGRQDGQYVMYRVTPLLRGTNFIFELSKREGGHRKLGTLSVASDAALSV